MLFPMSKIQIFESNSQPPSFPGKSVARCFRCQRYKFLKAIHNTPTRRGFAPTVVSDVKDTNFWKQFTTPRPNATARKQLFPMSKIQIFESNSQLFNDWNWINGSCFRCQRYKFLKAIHNVRLWRHLVQSLFPMSKIQIFESNSQPSLIIVPLTTCCFRCQRYKFLKAIHN